MGPVRAREGSPAPKSPPSSPVSPPQPHYSPTPKRPESPSPPQRPINAQIHLRTPSLLCGRRVRSVSFCRFSDSVFFRSATVWRLERAPSPVEASLPLGPSQIKVHFDFRSGKARVERTRVYTMHVPHAHTHAHTTRSVSVLE